MGQSLSTVYIHVVFHIKTTSVGISSEIRDNLYKYINGIIQGLGSICLQAGGTENHVHLLCTLPRTMAIAKLIEEIKRNSSKWIKAQHDMYRLFEWQSGYGVFSVSQSQVNTVIKYIQNQEEHHKKQGVEEELMDWCRMYNAETDDRYFLRD